MKLFLCYRRDDSAFASQAIYEKLKRRFGTQSVFIDMESIPPGIDFREHIQRSIAACQLVIAVIGPAWLGEEEDGRPRVQSSRDFVRAEIESALRFGVPILPVLIGKASMPSEGMLPEALKPLAFRQALQVRAGRDFDSDVDQVIRAVTDLTATQPPGSAAKPGDIHTTSAGIREVLLPAGVFQMGSPESDPDASPDEKPQRHVRISRPFFMTLTPITQRCFEMILSYNPSKHFEDKDRPVETISLADAAEFCNALSQSEGLLPFYEVRGQLIVAAGGPGYRLPREHEWEYACRAGTLSRWSFGDDDATASDYAWFAENTDETPQRTAAKLPNPWGLHDMHGNVWELCWDVLTSGLSGSLPASIAPPEECILRGGCFVDPVWALRSANRSSVRVAVRSNRIGFRVARSLEG